ncbi:hypothetical protein [Arthrobacter alpinus]|uniref:hypothetical protein n=1 Tax=Arthrobacter alpinus TaxID=656366 RepID=UPI0012FEF6D0|nr:hypothetical protein [Arthrobacter alpinus]
MKRRPCAAILSVVLLGGCSLLPSSQAPKAPSVVVNGNSQFTAAGIKDMKTSRQASIDVSERKVAMSALGFAEGSDGILIATDSKKLINVSITTPNGVVTMTTDTIRVRPGVPTEYVDHIDIFYNFPDAQDANAEIERARDELGFRALEDFPPIGPEFKDGSGKETWVPGLGNKTGTVFSVEAIANHTTGSLTWIYSIQLSDRYYTPEAAASIAETGDFDYFQKYFDRKASPVLGWIHSQSRL